MGQYVKPNSFPPKNSTSTKKKSVINDAFLFVRRGFQQAPISAQPAVYLRGAVVWQAAEPAEPAQEPAVYSQEPRVVLWRGAELTECAPEAALSESGLAVVGPPLAAPVVEGQTDEMAAPQRHAAVACFVPAADLPAVADYDAQFH